MEKIRIGLIGCGGRSTAHRHSFAQMDNVQVVAVADPVEARRAEASRQFGGARMYRDDAEFYARESRDTVDAVVICVEPTAHAISEERAIDLGIPFLVEKPMTLDLAQADRIAQRVAETGLITSVGFQDRYLDLMDKIKAELPRHKPGGLV